MKYLRSIPLYILIFILALSVSSCSTKKAVVKKRNKVDKVRGYAFNFHEAKSLSPILDKAAEEGKLVFVDLYTTWCLPCKLMDEDVFTDKATAKFMNKHFINYKVNAEKANGPDIKLIYGATAYPTLLFLDAKGKVLEKKTGTAYHTELIKLAKSAIDKNNLQSIN